MLDDLIEYASDVIEIFIALLILVDVKYFLAVLPGLEQHVKNN